jgi:hypothetical protein
VSSLLGPEVHLDHVAVAAGSPEHPLVRLAGFDATLERPMPSGVRVARFGPLELVSPERTGNPIERFLADRGPGLHHVAWGWPIPWSA